MHLSSKFKACHYGLQGLSYFFVSWKVNPVAFEVADQGGQNNGVLDLQSSLNRIPTNNGNHGGHDSWSYNENF